MYLYSTVKGLVDVGVCNWWRPLSWIWEERQSEWGTMSNEQVRLVEEQA